MNKALSFLILLSTALVVMCLEVLIPNGNWLYLFGLVVGSISIAVSFVFMS